MRLLLVLLAAGAASAAVAQERVTLAGAVPPEVQTEIAARGWETGRGSEGAYLVGPIPDVLFAASRTPGAWTAAVALGGNPQAAIETNRIFAANLALVPILWIGPPESAAAASALHARIPSLSFRDSAGTSVKQAFDWLAAQVRDPVPPKVDCETGSADFGRCYWAEIVKMDPAQRNDILAPTRIAPGAGAHLALGGFGYDGSAPGPGVLVGFLPQGYKGPLKLNDRIVALAGKPIEDARQYREWMDAMKEEKATAVLVQRGKERLRIETRIVLPRREETVTARIQAEYLPESHEIQVVSRGVAALRLTLAEHWAPARVNWNGNDAGELAAPGCWALGETGKATRCTP